MTNLRTSYVGTLRARHAKHLACLLYRETQKKLVAGCVRRPLPLPPSSFCCWTCNSHPPPVCFPLPKRLAHKPPPPPFPDENLLLHTFFFYPFTLLLESIKSTTIPRLYKARFSSKPKRQFFSALFGQHRFCFLYCNHPPVSLRANQQIKAHRTRRPSHLKRQQMRRKLL